MDAFARARQMMVDGQLRVNDVTNPHLIAAVQEVARERFVPAGKAELAYQDRDLEVLAGAPGRPARYLLKPLTLAKLLEIATITSSDRALDVGCATGYSSALLAQLAAQVVALEEEPSLAQAAAANLAAMKIGNATVQPGALVSGAPAQGPFDVILVNGSVETMPPALTAQIAEGGRLVCVMQRGPIGHGMVFRASGGHVSGRAVFDAVAPMLPGFAVAPDFVF